MALTNLECVSVGDEHVGYRWMDLLMLNFIIVGGQHFYCGGSPLFFKEFLPMLFRTCLGLLNVLGPGYG